MSQSAVLRRFLHRKKNIYLALVHAEMTLMSVSRKFLRSPMNMGKILWKIEKQTSISMHVLQHMCTTRIQVPS